MDTYGADKVREHYNSTVKEYDRLHGDKQDPEHVESLGLFWRYVRPTLRINSVLDVGCGTGRALRWICEREPNIQLSGVDPSEEMCQRAQEQLPSARISIGDGTKLDYADSSFDLVLATGVMHHIATTKPVLREMFRIARNVVLVSDHNEFAMGSSMSRRLRLALHSLGLLRSISFVRQGFKHRRYSREDGWYYPYSVLDDYDIFTENADRVLVLPTRVRGKPIGDNLLMRQSHIALVGLKHSEMTR